jgi:SHS2 domain-containing protein
MYELFEHTADLGLRVRAADLDTLFAEAGLALFSAIVEDPGTVVAAQQVDLQVSGTDREYLLLDWLRALLSRFDPGGLVLSRFEVHVGDDGLRARAWGEPLDPARHELGHEVKAITCHGLRVEPADGGWLAEAIVDI